MKPARFVRSRKVLSKVAIPLKKIFALLFVAIYYIFYLPIFVILRILEVVTTWWL